jgi:hypothetical protein
MKWPGLPTSAFVSGRLAEQADLTSGCAVFLSLVDGLPVGEPAHITIPQFAFLVNEDGSRTPAVVVQAEINERGTFFGLRDAEGQEYIVTAQEIVLLGLSHP